MQSLSWIQIQDNVTYLGIDMFKKKKKKSSWCTTDWETNIPDLQTIHGHSIYLVSMISHDK